MGNFEKAIPDNLVKLIKQLGLVRYQISDLQRPWRHDCDCEYCTEPQNEEVPDDVQAQIDELQLDVDALLLTINRLKRHAIVNGVKV